MVQVNSEKTSAALRRRQAREAKGYTLEELAVATGLTVDEIIAAEEPHTAAPEQRIERIVHALR